MLKKNKKRIISAESGQATVEYLLLLVVVIVIARFILTPLGKGLAEFSGALLGPDGYYYCLMTNGLVPSFEIITDKATGKKLDCRNLKLEAQASFNSEIDSIDKGLRKAGHSASGESERRNGNENMETIDSDSKNKGEANAKNKRKGGSAGQDTGGGSSSLSRLNKKKKKRRKKRIKVSDEKNFKSEFEKRRRRKKKRTNNNLDSGGSGEVTTTIIYIDDEEENKRPAIFKSSKSTAEDIKEDGKKGSLIMGPATESKRTLSNKEEGFELGRFLKYLIIAAIIIAILLVIFSQVMEFQNRD